MRAPASLLSEGARLIPGSVEAGGGAGRQAAPTSLGAGGVDGVGGAQKRKVRSVTGDP